MYTPKFPRISQNGGRRAGSSRCLSFRRSGSSSSGAVHSAPDFAVLVRARSRGVQVCGGETKVREGGVQTASSQ